MHHFCCCALTRYVCRNYGSYAVSDPARASFLMKFTMKNTMMEQISTHTELGSLYRTSSWTWSSGQGTCRGREMVAHVAGHFCRHARAVLTACSFLRIRPDTCQMNSTSCHWSRLMRKDQLQNLDPLPAKLITGRGVVDDFPSTTILSVNQCTTTEGCSLVPRPPPF